MVFDNLSQIERAALLKSCLFQLQGAQHELISYQRFMEINQTKQAIEGKTGEELVKATQVYHEKIRDLFKESSFINQAIGFRLFAMLNKTSKTTEQSKMKADTLATVVSSTLMRVPSELEFLQLLQVIKEFNLFVTDLIGHFKEIALPRLRLDNTYYEYQIEDPKKGRSHALEVDGAGLQGVDLQVCKGDYLKSKILLVFKAEIEKIDSEAQLEEYVKNRIKTPEYKVIAQGQGLTTRFFGLNTSSVNAFSEMVKEQKRNIAINDQINTEVNSFNPS